MEVLNNPSLLRFILIISGLAEKILHLIVVGALHRLWLFFGGSRIIDNVQVILFSTLSITHISFPNIYLLWSSVRCICNCSELSSIDGGNYKKLTHCSSFQENRKEWSFWSRYGVFYDIYRRTCFMFSSWYNLDTNSPTNCCYMYYFLDREKLIIRMWCVLSWIILGYLCGTLRTRRVNLNSSIFKGVDPVWCFDFVLFLYKNSSNMKIYRIGVLRSFQPTFQTG